MRTVSRHPQEASRERNIERYHTAEGRSILRKRKWIVEPPFGHMKTYGGLGLISCRGRTKAQLKVVMAAVAYDLIKLVAAKARKAGLLSALCALIEATRVYLVPSCANRRSMQGEALIGLLEARRPLRVAPTIARAFLQLGTRSILEALGGKRPNRRIGLSTAENSGNSSLDAAKLALLR